MKGRAGGSCGSWNTGRTPLQPFPCLPGLPRLFFFHCKIYDWICFSQMDADAIPWKISFPRQGLMQCFVTWLYSEGWHQLPDSWIRLIYVRYFKVSFRKKPNFRLWLNYRHGNSMDNFLSKLVKIRGCLKVGPVINKPELSDICLSLLYLNCCLGTNYTESGWTWLSSNPCSSCILFIPETFWSKVRKSAILVNGNQFHHLDQNFHVLQR